MNHVNKYLLTISWYCFGLIGLMVFCSRVFDCVIICTVCNLCLRKVQLKAWLWQNMSIFQALKDNKDHNPTGMLLKKKKTFEHKWSWRRHFWRDCIPLRTKFYRHKRNVTFHFLNYKNPQKRIQIQDFKLYHVIAVSIICC